MAFVVDWIPAKEADRTAQDGTDQPAPARCAGRAAPDVARGEASGAAKPCIVRCTATGEIGDGELARIAEAIGDGLESADTDRVLIDATRAEVVSESDEELGAVFARCTKLRPRPLRVGLVVTSDRSFDRARRVERRLAAEGITAIVFNSRRTAQVWLGVAQER